MRSIRKTGSDRLFYIVDYTFLTIAMLVVVFPLINILAQSLSTPEAVISGRVYLLPVGINFDSYKSVIQQKSIVTGFLNSIYYTSVGTVLNIAITIMAAYPLSRKDFKGRKVLMFYFVFTMLFGGGLIPTYLVVRALGLIDTRWAMIIPGAMAVWNMIIARTFFQVTIPHELYEAAIVDGASEIRVLFAVVLPLSVPIVAVLVMFYGVAHWNNFFDGLLYLRSQRLFNFQMELRNALTSITVLNQMLDRTADIERLEMLVERMKYAIIVVGVIPVMLLYPFAQRYFIKGITIGSLKG